MGIILVRPSQATPVGLGSAQWSLTPLPLATVDARAAWWCFGMTRWCFFLWCAGLCRACARCNVVSFSLAERECDWFHDCDPSILKTVDKPWKTLVVNQLQPPPERFDLSFYDLDKGSRVYEVEEVVVGVDQISAYSAIDETTLKIDQSEETVLSLIHI